MIMENRIIDYLNEMIPNPVCELNYSKDYELLLAVMLSAQTTDVRVNKVTSVLFKEYPTLEALGMANIDDIMKIVRPVGTYHKKAINVQKIAIELLDKYNGVVPNNRDFLESLSGVGRKTANVVLSILFNEPCIAVDTHVARVSARLGLAKKTDSPLIIEKKLTRKFKKMQLNKLHHQLLLFGRYYCKARKPLCKNCKLFDICKEKERNI